MRHLILIINQIVICALLWGLTPTILAADVDSEPRFGTVMALAGGSLRTAYFLGMVEEAIKQGKKPDVLVTTCGASLAGMIINHFGSEDPEKWFDFLKAEAPEGKDFYHFVRSIKVNKAFAYTGPLMNGPAGITLASLMNRRVNKIKVIPDIAEKYLVFIPKQADFSIAEKPFRSEDIRVVMIAAELLYDPNNKNVVGKEYKDKKLFQEVFITDPDTAKALPEISPIALLYPTSCIAKKTKTYTHFSLFTGARCSMSEPLLVNLMKVEDPDTGKLRFFTAGSVDSYGYEVAKHLGKDITSTAIEKLDDVLECPPFFDFYQYDIQKHRLASQRQKGVSHWIDNTDIKELPDFGPKKETNWTKGIYLVDNEEHLSTREAFNKVIDEQRKKGKERMLEALQAPKGSRAHIRNDDPPPAPATANHDDP